VREGRQESLGERSHGKREKLLLGRRLGGRGSEWRRRRPIRAGLAAATSSRFIVGVSVSPSHFWLHVSYRETGIALGAFRERAGKPNGGENDFLPLRMEPRQMSAASSCRLMKGKNICQSMWLRFRVR